MKLGKKIEQNWKKKVKPRRFQEGWTKIFKEWVNPMLNL